jgi:FixJ family two-component response regulator
MAEQALHGTVVILDESREVRAFVHDLLAGEGYTVEDLESAGLLEWRWSRRPPGCLVLGIPGSRRDELELLRGFQASWPDVPVVVLAGSGEVRLAVAAMKSGAVDVLEKPLDGSLLVRAVVEALARSSRRNPGLDRLEARALLARLTSREREVLDLVAAGFRSKEIARQLGISKKTIDAHRANLLRKLKAQSVADLVRIYAST